MGESPEEGRERREEISLEELLRLPPWLRAAYNARLQACVMVYAVPERKGGRTPEPFAEARCWRVMTWIGCRRLGARRREALLKSYLDECWFSLCLIASIVDAGMAGAIDLSLTKEAVEGLMCERITREPLTPKTRGVAIYKKEHTVWESPRYFYDEAWIRDRERSLWSMVEIRRRFRSLRELKEYLAERARRGEWDEVFALCWPIYTDSINYWTSGRMR